MLTFMIAVLVNVKKQTHFCGILVGLCAYARTVINNPIRASPAQHIFRHSCTQCDNACACSSCSLYSGWSILDNHTIVGTDSEHGCCLQERFGMRFPKRDVVTRNEEFRHEQPCSLQTDLCQRSC